MYKRLKAQNKLYKMFRKQESTIKIITKASTMKIFKKLKRNITVFYNKQTKIG